MQDKQRVEKIRERASWGYNGYADYVNVDVQNLLSVIDQYEYSNTELRNQLSAFMLAMRVHMDNICCEQKAGPSTV